jgi:hypothetical protein
MVRAMVKTWNMEIGHGHPIIIGDSFGFSTHPHYGKLASSWLPDHANVEDITSL